MSPIRKKRRQGHIDPEGSDQNSIDGIVVRSRLTRRFVVDHAEGIDQDLPGLSQMKIEGALQSGKSTTLSCGRIIVSGMSAAKRVSRCRPPPSNQPWERGCASMTNRSRSRPALRRRRCCRLRRARRSGVPVVHSQQTAGRRRHPHAQKRSPWRDHGAARECDCIFASPSARKSRPMELLREMALEATEYGP